MKRLILAGAVTVLAVSPSARATSGGYSIGVNFGADEPAGSGESVLAPSEVAGVPQVLQGNWINVSGASGTESALVADNKGTAVTTAASVEWTSAGTWASQGSRGENNNSFTGADRKIMTGYLDTGNATTTRVTFTGLPTELTSSGYDVYVYSLGGVTGRGGTYRLENGSGGAIGDPKLVSAPTNPGAYIEDTGASHDEAGTYALFTAVSSATLVVVATTEENPLSGTPRAPLNAVQLVARTGEVLPVVRSAVGDACTFSLAIDDLGAAVVNPSTISVKLDGQTVTTQNTKTGSSTTVRFDLLAAQNRFLASGSQHAVEVTLRDTRGTQVTATRNFTVPAYAQITAAMAITNFNASSSGFLVNPHQIEGARGPGDLNTIANAEAQLAGRVVDPTTGQPVANIADLSGATGGLYLAPVINWEQAGGDIDANNPDNFNSAEPEASPRPNDYVPGMSPDFSDNFVAEIRAGLELKRGCYIFGVNSDDGFLATIGGAFGLNLGSFNTGRGAADTLFYVVVEQDGVYPLRLLWWEGNGGANVEFFTVDSMTGERILVNDRTNAKAVRAFSTFRTGAALSSVGPNQSPAGVPRAPTIVASFRNDLTSVDQASIRLLLDNQQVNATTAANGTNITTRFTVPTQYAFGSTHTGAVVYAIAGVSKTNTFTFTVRSEGAADLPGGLAIEIEHFDYDGGQTIDAASFMPYTGSEYDGLGAINDVDYHQGGVEASNDAYRFGEDPNVPMDSQMEAGTLDVTRPGGWEVTQNYKIGWAGGDWYNYTRTFTNSNYKIYAAQSHGDAAGTANRLVSRYGVVTSGVGTTSQTVAEIGSYSEPATGGWGNNALVQVKQPNGQPTIVRLNGKMTIRVWVESGDFDWFAFVPTTEPTSAPSLSSVSLAQGAGSFGNDPLTFNLNDFLLEAKINTNTIRLTVNGASVTPTITRTEGGATVSYLPAGGFANGAQNYSLVFATTTGTSTTNTGSFNVLKTNLFVIEAEDFNYDSGKTKTEASTMPLQANLYNDLGAVAEVDYHVINDQQEADAQKYRQGESPNVPIPNSDGDRNRGSFELAANYRIGWIDNGEWFNYTRTFPNGDYNVYAGLSHGGGGPTSGSLQLVTGDATQANPALQQLGTFDQSGGTAGWGVNRLVPLRNSAGQTATVSLGGTQTIRYTANSGDYDYLIFAPTSGGGGNGPRLTIARNGNQITVTWTGGTLQSSTTVTGGWTPVSGATGGTYTTTVTSGQQMFFRAVQP